MTKPTRAEVERMAVAIHAQTHGARVARTAMVVWSRTGHRADYRSLARQLIRLERLLAEAEAEEEGKRCR